MSNSPKIAVIGAGHWGKNLVSNLDEMGHLEAVVDSSEELRSAIAEKYPDVRLFESVDALLESEVADAVAVAPSAEFPFHVP